MEESDCFSSASSDHETSHQGIEINSFHVSVRLERTSIFGAQINKARFKNPAWLGDLEPSAPANGYLMETGNSSWSLQKTAV
jgi:hypothetical protein